MNDELEGFLAPQEFEGAELVARGLRNVEISRILKISESHVATLVQKIKKRWRMNSRAAIAVKFNELYPDADARRAGYSRSCEVMVQRLKGRVRIQGRKCIGPRPRALAHVPISNPETRPDETLLPREFRVLALSTTGASNREIGEQLGLTENSVRSYMKHLCVKIGVENRVAAAVWFVLRYPTDTAVRRGYAQCELYALEHRRYNADAARKVRGTAKLLRGLGA